MAVNVQEDVGWEILYVLRRNIIYLEVFFLKYR